MLTSVNALAKTIYNIYIYSMNNNTYKWLLYLITLVIFTTIGIQLYWNYNNYKQNKQRVINDIQISLDNAIEAYFSELSKKNILTLVNTEDDITNVNIDFKTINASKNKKVKINSASVLNNKDKIISIVTEAKNELNKNLQKDTIIDIVSFDQFSKDQKYSLNLSKDGTTKKSKMLWGKKANDSLKHINGVTTVYFFHSQDSIDYTKIDSLLTYELHKKGIFSNNYLQHTKNEALVFSSKTENQEDYPLSTKGKSTYLKAHETLILNYKNPITETFKRSLFGILLSLLLTALVVGLLFYLLKIINKQKQLAEIKNDLISNITHEFKTPISTIGIAIESLKDFNALDDKNKTENYLNISNQQLAKLNTMVEKLLETATLDSDNLSLKKENTNIVELLKNSVKKYQFNLKDKTILFNTLNEDISIKIDIFHFENAINNIIDNAIKYGGNTIEILIKENKNHIEILISDNGNTLKTSQKDKIFEKFYRVPKGNTHDVKGFGIGLYYTKSIIEKHDGTIELDVTKNTTFKIALPNS